MNDPDGRLEPRGEEPVLAEDRRGMALLVVLVPAIVIIDFMTRSEIPMQTLYLFATGMAAWSFGLRAGLAVAVVAAGFGGFIGFMTRPGAAGVAPVLWEVFSGVLLYSVVAWLLARHRRYGEDVKAAYRVDADSGALSKREIQRHLDGEARRAWRYGRSVALLLLDASDAREAPERSAKFLASMVHHIRGAMRESDAVGRLEHAKFAVVLVECNGAEALVVANRMRESMLANLRVKPTAIAVGVASYGGEGPTTASELMAEAATHLSRARGGAGVVGSPPE